jgi:energy-coupling factor transporter ATP-binding protein EcfA2
MRLLEVGENGKVSLTKDLIKDIPRYAILSHTWGTDEEEVTFDDLKENSGKTKEKKGYRKIEFCAGKARQDGLQYFWIDTCCIDKRSHPELSEAIISMFRWYCEAVRCYVYLSDVSYRRRGHDQEEPKWESTFQASKWFTRGWTLQELLAPKSVIFFSREGDQLGDKSSLEQMIHKATRIPVEILRGAPLSTCSVRERMRWSEDRITTRKEDRAYCLLGIFGIVMPPMYGEGDHAFERLECEINRHTRDKELLLESLNSGSPFTRVNNIGEVHEGTFEWIFNLRSLPAVPFITWLQEGKGFFWIKGKPGSGKSTMIKFLAGLADPNEPTLQYLQSWAAPQYPCIISFYFWLPDASKIQNSFRGFCCSLLHQLLFKIDLESILTLMTKKQIEQKRQIENWDLEELRTTLKSVACYIASETPLCIFIDGLDECLATDLDRLMMVMKELAFCADSKIKICVSSRMEPRIENRMQTLGPRSLDLHELTKGDITQYVTNKMESCWQSGRLPTDAEKKELTDKIVKNSGGVFLWAFLVTRTLCESIEAGDTISHLREQLTELPVDILNLYKAMITKAGGSTGPRMAEAASYFRFAIDHCEQEYAHIRKSGMGACRKVLWGNLLTFIPIYEIFHPSIKSESPEEISQTLANRINFICAGILTADRGTVDFFHRTARDFFYDATGHEILRQSKVTQLDSHRLFIDAMCRDGHAGCFGAMGVNEAISMIRWLRSIEGTSDEENLQYLRHVDEAMSLVHTMRGGATQNWVYEQLGRFEVDDRWFDFTAVSIRAGQTLLLSQLLNAKQPLSSRYKDYLLLCSASSDIDPVWIQRLLDAGANPNATFYWGFQNRIKTSPWLQYLVSTGVRQRDHIELSGGWMSHPLVSLRKNSLDLKTVEAFLDKGAMLDDRTLLLKYAYFDVTVSTNAPQRVSRQITGTRMKVCIWPSRSTQNIF